MKLLGFAVLAGASPAAWSAPPRTSPRLASHKDSRFSETGKGKAHGLWNPHPALMEMLAEAENERSLLDHIHQLHTNSSYGPTASDWPFGPGHWPAQYFDNVPTQVCDLCGGSPGNTKWNDVSEKCATWTVQMLRCVMVCNHGNHYDGFGACMNGCTKGPPSKEWCAEQPANEQILKHCTTFVGRWEFCAVSTTDWEDVDGWWNAIDTCVYNCASAMETEMYMGQSLEWRSAKCNPTWFACNHGSSSTSTGPNPFQCGIIDPVLCEGPVGQGDEPCYYDSPWCGDEWWGCYPRPDDSVNTTQTSIKNKDGTETTIVHIENSTGQVVNDITMPRLPYVKPVAGPDWFTLIRPTPFAPPPTKPPPCAYNITWLENKTHVHKGKNATHKWKFTNWTASWKRELKYDGDWNGTYCHPPPGENVTKDSDLRAGALPEELVAKLKKAEEKAKKKAAKKAARKKKRKLLLQSGIEAEAADEQEVLSDEEAAAENDQAAEDAAEVVEEDRAAAAAAWAQKRAAVPVPPPVGGAPPPPRDEEESPPAPPGPEPSAVEAESGASGFRSWLRQLRAHNGMVAV